MLIVVKIGSSSITTDLGEVNETAIAKLCAEISEQIGNGNQIVIVTSGAIAAGVEATGQFRKRPSDIETLQAIASVGQPKLMRVYGKWLARFGLVLGQILLAPNDFSDRRQYLQARKTIGRLLELGVVPIINENDAIADEEIRFGDNDRLAALVAHMIKADQLILLTDTAGLYSADHSFNRNVSLIEEIQEISKELEAVASSSGSEVGSGGMASKLAAAKIASWSGIKVVICDSKRSSVLADAISGAEGVGTIVHPSERKLSSRKLWLAFAVVANGKIIIDQGAATALIERGTSLLPAGVTGAVGDFENQDAVEIESTQGHLVGRGIVNCSAKQLESILGKKTSDIQGDFPEEVVHRDNMVVFSETNS